MMRPELDTSPLDALAAAVGGTVSTVGIHVGTDLLYCGLDGQVRVQSPGLPVRDLGSWKAPTAELVAAYRGVSDERA